jgi:septum formation protein
VQLLLCSASPRRRALLAGLGLEFRAVSPAIDERRLAGEPVAELPLRLAVAKARAGRAADAAGAARCVALGADTVVSLDGDELGKPAGREEARALLRRLSGREHRVTTGVCAIGPDGAIHALAVSTQVRFRPLTEEQVGWLADSGEGDDKAGGYALQGLAGAFVERLEGSASGVIGLPLAETLDLLARAGLPLPWQRAGSPGSAESRGARP